MPPALLYAEPQLFAADMAAAIAFYTGPLGFSLGFTYGDPPYYGQVVRDGVRLNIRGVAPPPIDPVQRNASELLSASIAADDLDALFREYQAAGVTFAQALASKPWGARDFIVRDPDGNLILFFGR